MKKSKYRAGVVSASAVAHLVARNETQLAAVSQEDLASRALRVDASAVVRDDGRGVGSNVKLFGSEADDGGEGRLLEHLHDSVRKLRVRSQRDLERHLGLAGGGGGGSRRGSRPD